MQRKLLWIGWAFGLLLGCAASTEKALTSFGFVSPAVTGTIDEGSHAVAVEVPFGTAVTGLVATFAVTGTQVQVGGAEQTSGVTPNDFTTPVTYTVVAADGSSQDYVVTVTIAAPPNHLTVAGIVYPVTAAYLAHKIDCSIGAGLYCVYLALCTGSIEADLSEAPAITWAGAGNIAAVECVSSSETELAAGEYRLPADLAPFAVMQGELYVGADYDVPENPGTFYELSSGSMTLERSGAEGYAVDLQFDDGEGVTVQAHYDGELTYYSFSS
jgi:hypothetical protein